MSDRPNNSTICQEVNGYKRILGMTMPFDRRHPNPSKNYGIGGLTIRFVLLKDDAAVQFVANVAQYLPHVADELWNKRDRSYNSFRGVGMDVGYHSPRPMFENQEPFDCDLLSSGKCYYDGSSLRADEWFDTWLREGNDRIWEMLEQDWEDRFGTSGGE